MADASKTEKATPRRRQKAREKGQVARSKELSSALALGSVVAVLAWQMGHAPSAWTTFFRNTLDSAASGNLEPGSPLFFWSSIEVFRWIVPCMLAAWTAAFLGGVGQGGLVIATEPLIPNFERLSPARKLGQIFSITSVASLLKSLIPFAAIAYVGIACLEANWRNMIQASFLDVKGFAHLVGAMVLQFLWKTAAILLLWTGVDYFLNWRKIENDLKMSRQDLREEVKDTEGNPQIKGRVRKIQRLMRRQQLLKATKTATVVVTNPTHYAVALRYEPDMVAPVVVSKGRDLLAQKIKEVARWNDIPIMENPPLAQALYKSVEVGQTIPSKLYTAVAEILVVIYRAQAEMRKQAAQRSPHGAGPGGHS